MSGVQLRFLAGVASLLAGIAACIVVILLLNATL